MTIHEILDFLAESGNEVVFKGNKNAEITEMSNLRELKDHSICWIKNTRFASGEVVENLKQLQDVLVVCPFEIEGVNCVITDYPKGVFFSILNQFFRKTFDHVISENAVVLTDRIGKNVHIGANCYIGDEVEIGDDTVIHPNVSVICPCKIGYGCEIFPGVVIGADGFGYYMEHGIPYREIHFRGVVIGDHVDIGANTCVDRGLLTDTVICDHVKIDNLCHIGHNVKIEENCLIIAGTVICGSALIKRNAYLAPESVVMNQVTVGEGGMVGVNSAAITNVKDKVTVFGTPAKRLSPVLKK